MRPVRRLTAEVAERLGEILDGKNVSQSAIAVELGRAQSFVSVRLAGKKPLSTDDLDAIAKFLDMSGQDLLADISRRIQDGRRPNVTPIRKTVPTEDEALALGAVADTGVKEVPEFDEDPKEEL